MVKLRSKLNNRVIEVDNHDGFDKRLWRCRKTLDVNPEMCGKIVQFLGFTFDEESYEKFSPEQAGSMMRKMMNRIQTNLRKKKVHMDYVWRLEAGDRHGRFHIHVLTTLRLKRETWMKQWDFRGMIDVKRINPDDQKMVSNYLSKYVSKKSKRHKHEWQSNKYAKEIPSRTRLWGVSGGFKYRYLPEFLHERSITPVTPITKLDVHVCVERKYDVLMRWCPKEFEKYRKLSVFEQKKLWERNEKQFARRLISPIEYFAVKKALNRYVIFIDSSLKKIIV